VLTALAGLAVQNLDQLERGLGWGKRNVGEGVRRLMRSIVVPLPVHRYSLLKVFLLYHSATHLLHLAMP
jgi:hypothetical protein